MRNNLQTSFKSLMGRLEIQEPKTNKEKFNDWMRDRVRNVFYADTRQMNEAYQRIIEN